jgi:hypothetical protein
MFEAERVLLTDFAIIPIYSYVTKRLVDQHLRGWQNNVMDHHLTRYMYKLKSRQAKTGIEEEETAVEVEETAVGEEEIAVGETVVQEEEQ